MKPTPGSDEIPRQRDFHNVTQSGFVHCGMPSLDACPAVTDPSMSSASDAARDNSGLSANSGVMPAVNLCRRRRTAP